MVAKEIAIEMQDGGAASSSASTSSSTATTTSAESVAGTGAFQKDPENCCGHQFKSADVNVKTANQALKSEDETGARHTRPGNKHGSYAANKNVAEGLMDIALLSANANQLRFLITYNQEASTYYISLGLIALSLTMQVAVGIALIFKRRMRRSNNNNKRFMRTNEFLVGGVFIVTVINILLAAFTTIDGRK